MAACFSAREDGTPELPFDPRSGVLRPGSGSSGWTGTRCGWCRGTPTRCAPCAASGSTPGTSDDFYLDLGAVAFRDALAEAGVAEDVIRFELFDATHAGIDYRYPMSLAWLAERIAV